MFSVHLGRQDLRASPDDGLFRLEPWLLLRALHEARGSPCRGQDAQQLRDQAQQVPRRHPVRRQQEALDQRDPQEQDCGGN